MFNQRQLKIKLLFILLSFIDFAANAQTNKHEMALGLNYGFGHVLKNTDYTFTNSFIKGQFYFQLKKGRKLSYQLILQPEINFAKHQLLNLYFVRPEEYNYELKRERFTQLKNIQEYVLGIGFLIRKPISNKISTYALLSIGPMITNTETERLSKGFAFSDVLSIGVSAKLHRFNFDLRPSFRHNSNAGLHQLNSGINTFNFETGVYYQLN
jgi:hypothetical protein